MRSEPRRTDKDEVPGRTQAQEGKTAGAHQTQIGPEGPRPEPASPRRHGAISGRPAPPAAVSAVAVVPASPPPSPAAVAVAGHPRILPAAPPPPDLVAAREQPPPPAAGSPPRHEASTPLPRQPRRRAPRQRAALTGLVGPRQVFHVRGRGVLAAASARALPSDALRRRRGEGGAGGRGLGRWRLGFPPVAHGSDEGERGGFPDQ
nr:oleosin-B6-like [Lolium perenne]